MAWTKETVWERLMQCPDFNELNNEYNGKFLFSCDVKGTKLLLSNSVGGSAEAYLIVPINMDSLEDVQDFARIAIEILQERINN